MTPTKIIERLVHWQPRLFDQLPLVPERCVMATRVGIDVLARFGIAAEPRPVIAGIWNEGYERFRVAREGMPELAPPPDAWSVWAGLPPEVGDRPLGPKRWHGHLVVWVPAKGWIIDLDVQAFHRPAKGLVIPDGGLIVPWPRGESIMGRVRCKDGHVLYAQYRRNDANQQFLGAPDWRSESFTNWVDAIERAIRKGGPV